MNQRNNSRDDSELEERRLTLFEHLDELRSRIIKSLVGIMIGTVIAFIFSAQLIDILISPAQPVIQKTYFTSPLQPFNVRLKAAFFAGMVFASPIFLYQLWQFIRPALTKKEKNVIRFIFYFALIAFLVGVCFAYFVILPVGIKVLISYKTPLMEPLIGISELLNFVVFFLLAMGLVFELPLVMMGLGKIGLINSRILNQNRRFAIFGAVILACVVTPGSEVLTSLILAIPLYLLFELSIILIKFVESKEQDDEY